MRDRPGAAVRAAILGSGVPGSRRGKGPGRTAGISQGGRRAGAEDQAPAVRRRADAGGRAPPAAGRARGAAARRRGARRTADVRRARADSLGAQVAARAGGPAGPASRRRGGGVRAGSAGAAPPTGAQERIAAGAGKGGGREEEEAVAKIWKSGNLEIWKCAKISTLPHLQISKSRNGM